MLNKTWGTHPFDFELMAKSVESEQKFNPKDFRWTLKFQRLDIQNEVPKVWVCSMTCLFFFVNSIFDNR